MTTGALAELSLEELGRLTPISRLGGQGRVHRPERQPPALTAPVVVKLYRQPPPASASSVLKAMVAFRHELNPAELARLDWITTWPLAIVTADGRPVGIAMNDVSTRFTVQFVMPSGRRESVLLSLEHLLGHDSFLQARGVDVALDTVTRAWVAERVSAALGQLHRHAIVASDIAPSNLLVSFPGGAPAVCFIDCDSMVFRGRQGLEPVETGDWDMPADFAEQPRTRASDVYKLGLLVLRLFARCHDARSPTPHLRHLPIGVRDLLYRALAPDAVNRPSAGEWERALGELLASGDLNQRYPGPAAPPRPAETPAIARQVADNRRATAVGRLQRATPRTPATGGHWLRPAVALLWIVAGIVVFTLLLSRLFAVTIPNQSQLQYGSPTGYPYYTLPGRYYALPGRSYYALPGR